MVTACPYHGVDTTQENFIYQTANDLAGQMNPLGIPLLDYPQWLREGTSYAGHVQAEIRKAAKAT